MPAALPVLWYFADPMCSWCWGFSPVIEAIREQYGDRLKIALMLGGLRPEVSTGMSQSECDEILQHWREVHARSGQTFSFDGAPVAGFVYDTEPASRAVISVGALDAAARWTRRRPFRISKRCSMPSMSISAMSHRLAC